MIGYCISLHFYLDFNIFEDFISLNHTMPDIIDVISH